MPYSGSHSLGGSILHRLALNLSAFLISPLVSYTIRYFCYYSNLYLGTGIWAIEFGMYSTVQYSVLDSYVWA